MADTEKNTEFVDLLLRMKQGDTCPFNTLTWEELFNLMYPAGCQKNLRLRFLRHDFKIHCYTAEPIDVGYKPKEKRTIPKDTKVLFWMASRMGDIGVTDNLTDPKGYDCRIPEENVPVVFRDWIVERIKVSETQLQ